MDKVLEDAIAMAERTGEVKVGWAFGALRESIETLQAGLIACVMRSPGTGFDGWRYLEKEHIHKEAVLEALETTLQSCLELLQAVRRK